MGRSQNATIDVDQLRRDLDALRAEMRSGATAADLAHFRRIALYSRLLSLLGLGLAFIPNPVSVLALAAGSFARWTIVAHHACHRGLDRAPGCPERWRGRTFARGWRRVVDWFDWMAPDAWHHEHDVLHHSHLGEERDPDVAERNAFWVRGSRFPRWARYAIVLLGACVWKPLYYAPSTMNHLLNKSAPQDERHGVYDWRLFSPLHRRFWVVALRCWLPYSAWRFGVLPALFLPLGTWAWGAALLNLVLAELVTNFWSFWVIVPNHTGDDLYRFDTPVRGRGQYYLRQIVGSTNYRCGGDLNDFLQGWLNYQIEHHLFPDLAPSQYQRLHPRVKAICAYHGVPFRQEPIWTRCARTMRVLVGETSMRTWSPAGDAQAADSPSRDESMPSSSSRKSQVA